MNYYENPEIRVTPLSFERVNGELQVDLGDQAANALYSGLLGHMVERADKAYTLKWQGDTRVPRGAELGRRVIGWTQHGRVISEGGEFFGLYERIRDAEGPNRDSEMLVVTFPERDEAQQ